MSVQTISASKSARDLFLILGLSVVFRYFGQMLLARVMSVEAYGLLSFVSSSAELLSIPASLGLGAACVKFLPQYIARQQWDLAKGFLTWAGKKVWLSGLVFGLALIVFLKTSPWSPRSLAGLTELDLGLPTVAGIFAITAFLQYTWQRQRACGDARGSIVPNMLLRPMILFGAAAWVFASDSKMSSSQGLSLLLLALLIVWLVQEIWFHCLIPDSLKSASPRLEIQEWKQVSRPMLFGALYFHFLNLGDIFVLGFWVESEQLALYQVAAKTALLVQLFWLAADTAWGPRLSSMFASSDRTAIQIFINKASHWIFWPTLLTWLGLLVLGPWLLGLFGPAYAGAYPELCIVAAAYVLWAYFGLSASTLNFSGQHQTVTRAYAGAALLHFCLCMILIPLWGIRGAAVSLLLSTLAWNLYLQIQMKRHLDLRSRLRFSLRAAARSME